MSVILHIESATTVCSVALSKNGTLLGFRETNDGYRHAELLTVFAEELIKEHLTSAKELTAISVSNGPGSYTGLRIGVSVAKGLCYALNIPLITLATLKILASSVQAKAEVEKALIVPMIDARRMEVYTACYNSSLEELSATHALVLDEHSFMSLLEKQKIIFIGDGSPKWSQVCKHPNAIFMTEQGCSAAHQISIAEEQYNQQVFADLAYCEPFYLKEFQAGKPKV